MKLKDLHTNLKKEINLLEFHPKKEIEVDSFGVEENIINDISKNKLKKSIQLRKNSQIKVKKINKKNNFDSIKFNKNNKKIDLLKKSNNNFLPSLKGIPYFEIGKIFGWIINIKAFNKIPKIFVYIILIIFIVFTDKQAVEYFTNSGYKKLQSLKNNYSLTEKKDLINSSSNNLKIAEILFLPFKIIPGEKINNTTYIIEGGIKSTNLLKELINFTNKTSDFIEKKSIENIAFSQLLYNSKNIFKYTQKELNRILKIYNKVNFSDNIILQNKLDYLKKELNKGIYYSSTINNNFETFLDILGHNKRKKYLIVLQNNDEIRPQGGFMGSMGIAEVFRGKLEKFEKRDIYDYEFKIKKEYFKRELAPEGINKMTPYLGLRDSNYFIDIKKSSEKINFFINKAGFDIDGIIYINQNTLFEILDLIGEYDSKVLKTKVNSKNFSVIMSSLVEAKKSHIGTLGTPKKILFDFIEEFKEIIKSEKINKTKIFKIILKDLKNREITIYNFNKKERELLKELEIFNPIQFNESLDFSYPVFTSISGNKSDRYISTSYKKTVKKGKKCEYKSSLEINLEHTFNNKILEKNKVIFKKFGIKKDIKRLLSIQGNGENKQYVRIILPKNSLIEKNKNIISIKNYYKRGKVIDFYLNTKVGEKSNIKINYTLKNKECLLYNYKLYKQPGIRKYDLKFENNGKKINLKNLESDLFIN